MNPRPTTLISLCSKHPSTDAEGIEPLWPLRGAVPDAEGIARL